MIAACPRTAALFVVLRALCLPVSSRLRGVNVLLSAIGGMFPDEGLCGMSIGVFQDFVLGCFIPRWWVGGCKIGKSIADGSFFGRLSGV